MNEILSKISMAGKTLQGTVIEDFLYIDTLENRQHFYNTLQNSKYLLIDFWSSWCIPCRQNAPVLRKIYAKYHSKGLEIFSLSLDSDKRKWTQSIYVDSLNQWKHGRQISKFQIENNLGIEVIPVYLLLNDQFEIIGRYNGRQKGLNDLLNKLEKLLK
jgi:thiol-disulfide isomerase/thioredoxin